MPTLSPSPNRADAEILGCIYHESILLLRPYREPARAELHRRGLGPADIEFILNKLGYSWLPVRSRAAIAKRLIDQFGEATIARVPGFLVKRADSATFWTIGGREGLLIPIRDEQQRIIAMIVRASTDAKGQRYRYLSSKRNDVGGSGPGTPVHVPRFTGDRSIIRVTEGCLKTDVATHASGILTIGLPGVGSWRKAPGILKSLGAEEAIVAFDSDWRTNAAVASSLKSLVRDLQNNGFVVALEMWAPSYGKGIDDCLSGGYQPEQIDNNSIEQLLTSPIFESSAIGEFPIGKNVQPSSIAVAIQKHDATFPGIPSITDPEGRTDLSNSRRFKALHGDRVKFCQTWNRWIAWDGCRWAPDESGAVYRLAKTVADSIWSEVRSKGDDSALQFAASTASCKRITAMLTLAKSELPVLTSDLDQHPFLLNCPNGTIDLRTGTLHEHRREDLLTKLCPTEFHAEASSFHFDRFREDIFEGTEDVEPFLQRLMGYCATADVREQILTVFHGTGSNGKSTFLEAIIETLGPDYTGAAARDLLLERKGNSHPTEIADLYQKRLVVAQETDANRTLAESLVKSLTGGDTIKARRMREDFWEFKPTHKIVLCTNHRPRVKGTDHAIWRRLRLVPFNIGFEGERKDKTIPEKLRKERPGILAWIVEGARLWLQAGLQEPDTVRLATAEYQSDSDVIGRFISDCCITLPGQKVKFA
ncbi:phage/plasmid primase, P4 family [Planctomicrobium sp. SH664]|uniref:phage/plasmid primase, P4 family n=1 Tax=Planctomicrobium sp. SH664 TaxID=3448125 RepID=UPI003F5B38B8